MKLLKRIMLPTLMTVASVHVHAQSVQQELMTETFDELDLFSPKEFQVIDIKKQISKVIASQIQALTPRLQTMMSEQRLSIPLQASLMSGRAAEQVNVASSYTRMLKGLNVNNNAIFQLRLADSAMLAPWSSGEKPLIAFAPKGDDTSWLYIEAYDHDGNVHLLDAQTMPLQPVLIVEIDGRKSAREGLAIMQSIFAQNQDTETSAIITSSENDADVLSTSNLKRIRLNDDKEPWISGNAEIYAVVTGVSPTRDEPILDIVDMPYLDNDGRDYTPNQTLIHWNRYRWQAADVLLMEQDDNTNYQTLATTFLDIVTQAMRAIPDPNVQGYAIIPQLTNQLIKAMPAHWFSNDDDYVDVFYTLFEGQNYNNHMGASGNAKVTIKPLNINPR
ncbi:hypothetical protein BGP78_13880 [Pseudoalteromonas sp. MSK9-3]|uniref:DUF3103 family protein n=1 Tax=Pseudoalteromonas sp. MSK9-3 TaxID=1897633 RepID=UPI000E6BAA52|nr:DUF3103 family protein [Pseudoalteromonas sp. MSK9-3]RJE76098.1 hypothetical protein BGP78_13880 [Pseudoalteromonas sp. MSK9-3]